VLIQSRLVVSEVSKSPSYYYYYKGESVCRGCDEYGWLAVHTPKERVALSYYYYNDYYYTTTTIRLCDCCCCCWVSRVWLSLHTRHGPCLRFILSGSFLLLLRINRGCAAPRVVWSGVLHTGAAGSGGAWQRLGGGASWCVVVRGGGGGTGCMGRSAVGTVCSCV